jgi:hypothetical protein
MRPIVLAVLLFAALPLLGQEQRDEPIQVVLDNSGTWRRPIHKQYEKFAEAFSDELCVGTTQEEWTVKIFLACGSEATHASDVITVRVWKGRGTKGDPSYTQMVFWRAGRDPMATGKDVAKSVKKFIEEANP